MAIVIVECWIVCCDWNQVAPAALAAGCEAKWQTRPGGRFHRGDSYAVNQPA
jgi:hypothetical protein